MTQPLSIAPKSDITALDDIISQKNDVAYVMLKDPRVDARYDVPLLSVPEGRDVQSVRAFLDEYLERPLRRRGEAVVQSAQAFLDLVERFKGESSVVYANPDAKAPSLTAIFNYHAEGSTEAVDAGDALTGWGDHRGTLACRMSDEWKAWLGVHGRELDQAEFAAFLQDHIADCVLVDTGKEPTVQEVVDQLQARLGGPVQLMKLARGLEVRAGVAVKNAVTLETGEIQISHVEQHQGENGGPITTPTLFFITIPVFYAGVPYRIAVRLRYRIRGAGAIAWSFHLYRHDKTFDHAFDELLQKVRDESGLDVFLGSPEK